MSPVIPNVIEKTPHGERGSDIFSRLLRENIIFLGTPIDDMVANVISAQLLHLEAENPDRDTATAPAGCTAGVPRTSELVGPSYWLSINWLIPEVNSSITITNQADYALGLVRFHLRGLSRNGPFILLRCCLLYTSDAADE